MSSRLPSLRKRLSRQFVLLALLPALAVPGATSALQVPSLIAQAESHNADLALAVRDQLRLQLDVRLRAAAVLADTIRSSQPAGQLANPSQGPRRHALGVACSTSKTTRSTRNSCAPSCANGPRSNCASAQTAGRGWRQRAR